MTLMVDVPLPSIYGPTAAEPWEKLRGRHPIHQMLNY